jgi:dodecin
VFAIFIVDWRCCWRAVASSKKRNRSSMLSAAAPRRATASARDLSLDRFLTMIHTVASAISLSTGNLRRLSYTLMTFQAQRPRNCGREKEITMSVAKVTEIIADSPKSFEDAVASGIKRANKTLKNIRGAWVRDHEVVVDEKGNITQFRVKMKVTFVLTD